jgi:hypothetical protein
MNTASLDHVKTALWSFQDKVQLKSLDKALEDYFITSLMVKVINTQSGSELNFNIYDEYDENGHCGYSFAPFNADGEQKDTDLELIEYMGYKTEVKFQNEDGSPYIYNLEEIKNLVRNTLSKSIFI